VPMSGDNFSRRYSIVAETRRKWSDTEKQIEELAATALRIAHLVWSWVEGALFDEDVRLGSLAVVFRGHLWLRWQDEI
jgi:hypothetical protein